MVISSTQTSDFVLLKRDVTSQFSSVNVPSFRSGSQAREGGGVLADIRTPPLYFALKVVAGDLTLDEHRLAGLQSDIAKATSTFIQTGADESGLQPLKLDGIFPAFPYLLSLVSGVVGLPAHIGPRGGFGIRLKWKLSSMSVPLLFNTTPYVLRLAPAKYRGQH